MDGDAEVEADDDAVAEAYGDAEGEEQTLIGVGMAAAVTHGGVSHD